MSDPMDKGTGTEHGHAGHSRERYRALGGACLPSSREGARRRYALDVALATEQYRSRPTRSAS